MSSRRVGIIGGGFTGLTAAHRLAAEGCAVTVFEATDALGGLAAGFELLDQPVERAYHFLYRTDKHILDFAAELGLAERITFHRSSVATYYVGVLYPMMTPLDLLRFRPIGLMSRLRAGVSVLYLQKVRNWQRLTRLTALAWLQKWAGQEVTDVIWKPLLRGKFSRYYDRVAMSWLWGRVKQRVDSRVPGEATERLGYFDGGFRVLVDALERSIRAAGATIRTRTPVSRLAHDPASGEVVVTVGGREERFDRVLVTVASNVLARLIGDYEARDPDYFAKIRSIDYLDAVVHVFASAQRFTPYYWHNINTPDAPFVVFLSLTNLIGSESFGGQHVYYVGAYVPPEHPYMTLEADDLKQGWYRELASIFPDFDAGAVLEDALFRFRNAQHIVDVGFEDKLPPHQTPCPGVLLANFSQIYPMDRGTNYAVRDGLRMAERILADFDGGAAAARAPVAREPAL